MLRFCEFMRFWACLGRTLLLLTVTPSSIRYLEQSRPLLLFLDVAAWQISVRTSRMLARMFMQNHHALIEGILAVHHELAEPDNRRVTCANVGAA